MKIRKHPGIIHNKFPDLPDWITKAIKIYLDGST